MSKKFLAPFAVLAGAFSTEHASAIPSVATPTTSSTHDTSTKVLVADGLMPITTANGDVFNFVLKRNSDTGLIMAAHRSHSSHASHASHTSHYSSSY